MVARLQGVELLERPGTRAVPTSGGLHAHGIIHRDDQRAALRGGGMLVPKGRANAATMPPMIRQRSNSVSQRRSLVSAGVAHGPSPRETAATETAPFVFGRRRRKCSASGRLMSNPPARKPGKSQFTAAAPVAPGNWRAPRRAAGPCAGTRVRRPPRERCLSNSAQNRRNCSRYPRRAAGASSFKRAPVSRSAKTPLWSRSKSISIGSRTCRPMRS